MNSVWLLKDDNGIKQKQRYKKRKGKKKQKEGNSSKMWDGNGGCGGKEEEQSLRNLQATLIFLQHLLFQKFSFFCGLLKGITQYRDSVLLVVHCFLCFFFWVLVSQQLKILCSQLLFFLIPLFYFLHTHTHTHTFLLLHPVSVCLSCQVKMNKKKKKKREEKKKKKK